VQSRWPLTEETISAYLSALEAGAFLVEDMPIPAPAVVSDPDDDPIVQTAILGQRDVLVLAMLAFGHARVLEICGQHGVRILGDVALMQELRREPSRETE